MTKLEQKTPPGRFSDPGIGVRFLLEGQVYRRTWVMERESATSFTSKPAWVREGAQLEFNPLVGARLPVLEYLDPLTQLVVQTRWEAGDGVRQPHANQW